MGMGYVSTGAVRQEREGHDFPGCQHRGARADLGDLSKRSLGYLGELVAARFLAGHGATDLAHNVRVGRGELDLVALLGNERVAVEVKTSRADSRGEAGFHFDRNKREQVRRLASSLGIWRVDYIGVEVASDLAIVTWLPRVC